MDKIALTLIVGVIVIWVIAAFALIPAYAEVESYSLEAERVDNKYHLTGEIVSTNQTDSMIYLRLLDLDRVEYSTGWDHPYSLQNGTNVINETLCCLPTNDEYELKLIQVDGVYPAHLNVVEVPEVPTIPTNSTTPIPTNSTAPTPPQEPEPTPIPTHESEATFICHNGVIIQTYGDELRMHLRHGDQPNVCPEIIPEPIPEPKYTPQTGTSYSTFSTAKLTIMLGEIFAELLSR